MLDVYSTLRWLNTVFRKMENSRFRSVFLGNYYLLKKEKCLTDIKQHRKSCYGATMTFQDGGYFGAKVI